MPLRKGAQPGSAGFRANIRAEVAAGKPVKQAVAIAYSEARRGRGRTMKCPHCGGSISVPGSVGGGSSTGSASGIG